MTEEQNKTVSQIDYINLFIDEIDENIKQLIQENCISATSSSNMEASPDSNIENISTEQQNILTNLCILQTILQNTTNEEKVTSIITKLIDEMDSGGKNFLGTSTETNAIVDAYNKFKNDMDANTLSGLVKDCILSQDQENIRSIMANSVEDTSFTQLSNNIAECIKNNNIIGYIDDPNPTKTATIENMDLNSFTKLLMNAGSLLSVFFICLNVLSIVSLIMIGRKNPYLLGVILLVIVLLNVSSYFSSKQKKK
jgi:hypothetical protein